MISPVQPLTSTEFRTNTNIKNSLPQKDHEPKKATEPIKWYCNSCGNNFKVPNYEKHKDCKIPSCPYCGNKKIVDNQSTNFKESLWGIV